MKRLQAILLVLAALWLAGCIVHGKGQTADATPPPPQPLPQPAPPPSAPLSIPQTQAQLPPPQPVNADALAAAQSSAVTVEAPAATRPARRPPAATAAQTTPGKPETPPAVAPPVQSSESERGPIQEIVAPDVQNRYRDSAETRRKEVNRLLEQAKLHRLTTEQNKLVRRVVSFLKQSDSAEQHGDLKQADSLAERALVLARALTDVR